MADLKPILIQTHKWERGYQAHPGDKGNYNSWGFLVGTNRGISAKFYEGILGSPPTSADMKAISKEKADSIYKKFFWKWMNGDKIKNQSIASLMFFITMNAGPGRNKEFVNKIFEKLGYAKRMNSGTVDNEAAKLINKNPKKFYTEYYKLASNFYSSGDPTFRGGWMRRLSEQQYSGQRSGKTAFIILTTALLLLVSFYFINRKYKLIKLPF